MSEMKARLETLKRLYNEYWAPGNLDRIDEVLDPAIAWTAIESAPDAGTRRGYDECRAYMKEWLDDFILDPAEIHEVGSTRTGEVVCSFALNLSGVEWRSMPGGAGLDIPVLRVPLASIDAWWTAGEQTVESASTGGSWFFGGTIPIDLP